MTFYAEMADVADELLTEFGVAVTIKYVTIGAYDPATGSAPRTVTSLASVAYVEDYADRDIDGTKIKQGDRRIYLSAVGTTKPGTVDLITIDGADYAVINSKAHPGAGTASLYELQVRK